MPLDRIRTMTRRIDSIKRAIDNRIIAMVRKGQMEGLNQWEKEELRHLEDTLQRTVKALTESWDAVLAMIKPFPDDDPDPTP